MVREAAPADGAAPSGPDWLSPTVVMSGVFGIYVGGRLLIGKLYHLPLFWGGSPRDEAPALLLVAAFALAETAGVWLAPRTLRVRLAVEKRSLPARHLGALLALGYAAL